MPKATRVEFAAMVRRADLKLTDANIDELYQVWGHVEAMMERLRTPAPGLDAEPAHIFKPEDF